LVLKTDADQFTGRLRDTFRGRRGDDAGGAFVMTIHPT